MTVLILGGYGTFGSHLCELLTRDSRKIIIAGRNLNKAEKLAKTLNADTLYLDRDADLVPILATKAETVVDASGPYNAYGKDPYRVAQFCLENGINYIDLSDNAEFTENITQFDALAKSKSCFALSGASSVPAISAAAVTELSKEMITIDSIETAIMPGNKAPRGYSVISSILSQVGLPQKRWQNGAWRFPRCWTEERIYKFGNGQKRVAKTIGAPDLHLFPSLFKARSVTFRAGMELSILNISVSMVALLNRIRNSPPPDWLIYLCHKLAIPTLPFGTNEGGMIVELIGQSDKSLIKRTWQLWATHGDGPYIPTVTARAILRRIDTIQNGARPCIVDINLADLKDALADLNVTDTVTEKAYQPLFQRALGSDFNKLPQTVRDLHSHTGFAHYKGISKVTRGKTILSKIIADVFGFPKEGLTIPVQVTLSCQEETEIWRRTFAGKTFHSVLTHARQGHFHEQFGPFTFEMELPVENKSLKMPVIRGWFLGIPIPPTLLPISETLEFEKDGCFHFDVALSAPLCGLLVRYQGSLILDIASDLA